MNNVLRTQDSLGERVEISGVLNENVDLEAAIGKVEGSLRVCCRDVTRINSMGIKNWLSYFQKLSRDGVKLTFVECADAIVQQLNMVSNFLCGGSLESFYVPLRCTSCDSESRQLLFVETIVKQNLQVPSHPCEVCKKGVAEFDDLSEELFRFLSKEAKR